MPDLPAQVHEQGTALAPQGASNPYAIDQTMVQLPSLYLAQYSSKAFKARRVGFGDIYVAIGAEDPNPVVVGTSTGDGLSEPVRFYIHSIGPGFQVVDESAPYGKRSLRPGTTYGAALAEVGGDPRKVFQQTYYTLTVPAYPLLPVRSIMGSRWGGRAGRWLNTQVGILLQQKRRPLDVAFQIQTKPDKNDDNEFVSAVVGIADVKAADAKADQELVAKHAETLATRPIQDTYDVDAESTDDASSAPSLG